MQKRIILRFAPSPTGDLHIGSVRTLLFNYIYSLKNSGKLLLRIDDTDASRSSDEYKKLIFRACDFLQIKFDEVYEQSKRKSIYDKYLDKLFELNKVYYCHCEKGCDKSCIKENYKDGVLRFKSEGIVYFNDQNFGRIKTTVENFAIMRGDKSYLYIFTSAVDDIDMQISHIIRGSDHIANSAKQVEIFQALKVQEPTFVHIPLLHNPNGSKLSKRDHNSSFKSLVDQGFLQEAIVNFLIKLGWSSKANVDYFQIKDIIQDFNFDNFQTSPAIYNFSKLEKINQFYIQKLGFEEIIKRLKNQFGFQEPRLTKEIFDELIKRAKNLIDLIKLAEPLKDNFLPNVKFEIDLSIFKEIKMFFMKSNIDKQSLENFIKENNLNKREAFRICRILLLGQEHGIDFFLVINQIPFKEILKRLENPSFNT